MYFSQLFSNNQSVINTTPNIGTKNLMRELLLYANIHSQIVANDVKVRASIPLRL